MSMCRLLLGCFILFHSYLYHYGDKSSLTHGGQGLDTLRAFAYLVEAQYLEPQHVETFSAPVELFFENDGGVPDSTGVGFLHCKSETHLASLQKCKTHTWQ